MQAGLYINVSSVQNTSSIALILSSTRKFTPRRGPMSVLSVGRFLTIQRSWRHTGAPTVIPEFLSASNAQPTLDPSGPYTGTTECTKRKPHISALNVDGCSLVCHD